ncbi:U3 small nucleolar ribonucleoprotein protein MPP10-like [Penaeus chinensis]|uniref:U3 small nucleolar ribonucleoprotein protein MPP10-like n=1 Tax=Penaeus chinensis TaxID=139456 RepID=UPI001FB61648|nr:U3 small nucleolar ribonucleoprotein protein MPP10-like [Penaeus chinensis]
MDTFSQKLNTLLKKPEEYLRPQSKLREAWVTQTKAVYDFMKSEEKCHDLPKCREAVPELYTDGLDDEQIWQLVELQNKGLLASPDNLESLDDSNLCYMVAKLSSLAKYDKLGVEEDEGKNEGFDGGGDEGSSGLGDEESSGLGDSEDGGFEDFDDNEDDLGEAEDGMEDDEEEDSDDDLLVKPEDIEKTGLNLDFGMDTDDEPDNFDDLIAPEGKETDDEEEEEENEGEEEDSQDESGDDSRIEKERSERKRPVKPSNFARSKVDSQFFNLRESEWIADNDILGQNYDIKDDDVDYMQDMSDGEEEDEVMYKDFFDEAPDGENANTNGEVEEEQYEEDDTRGRGYSQRGDNDGDSSTMPLLGQKQLETKSSYEKEREKELRLIDTLEEDVLTEKPWHLRGEISAANRPENSALEEQMDYNIGVKQKPVITEDITTLLERVILGRIRSKAFDDVERKVKVAADPFEFKKKLLLDQEKSKQSLAEIYEQEYIKQNEGSSKKDEEETREHKEIRERMDSLFSQLDMLANFHYMPKQVQPEVKIKSNLPAISIEEATPLAMSDASTLAPQEIMAPVQGELVGKDERTATDKKRERRKKKQHQKSRALVQDKKLKEKLKKAGPDGKLNASSMLKVVEKAVKAGHVKMLDGQQNKTMKTSQAFFKQLQDNVSGGNKPTSKKKKKTDHGLSASKILL